MAKMIDKMLLLFHLNRIESLKAKQAFLKDYAAITLERQKMKRLQAQKNRWMILEANLKHTAILAGVETDLIKTEKTIKLEQIDTRFYWRERAIRETARRQMAKKTQTEADILKKRDRSLDLLTIQKEKTMQCVLAKYQPTPEDLLVAKANYDLRKSQAGTVLATNETKLLERANAWDEHFTARMAKQEARLARAINIHQAKIDDTLRRQPKEDHGLPEDVLLRLEGLSMRFGGLVAVDDLSFDVKEGEIFGLIGPNGAGKTTVFNCITKFYRPTSGKMYFRKNPVEVILLNDYPVHRIIRQGIVRTFQNVELIWELSVIDNLLVAAHSLFHTGFFGQMLHTRKLRQEEMVLRNKAEGILTRMGLAPYMHQIPYGLPYGILKKIELARTLMIEPRMIILDEPAAGLNDRETEELALLIREIREKFHVTIFLVEHDMGLVMDICDTVAAISFGKLLAIGSPKMIQSNKIVRDAYLGEE